MALTPDQVRFFRHNGYLKLGTHLQKDFVTRLKEIIWRDIEAEVPPVAKDAEGRVARLSKVLDRDAIFMETATLPEVITPLSSLLGPNIELVKNRHNHATLNRATSRVDRFHRDVNQWTRGLVTVIFYLEEATEKKGCTLLVPGSHLLPAIATMHGVSEEAWVQQAGILDQAVPAPMPAGSMLVIDSLIFHRIGTNRTDETRMSVTFAYHSADELAGVEDKTRVLVCGERPYRGNDL